MILKGNRTLIYRPLRTLCTIFTLILIPINCAVAHVKRVSLDDKPLRIIEGLHKHDNHFPSTLATDKDVFLVIFATAASSDFYVLARPSVNPVQLSRILDSAVAGTQLASEPVMYMQSRGYTWADAYIDRSRLWSLKAKMRQPVGPVISHLRKAGFKPHTALCILKGATHSQRCNLHGFVGRNWVITNVSPDRTNLDFSLHARMSSFDIVLILLLLFAVPMIGIIAVPVIISITRSKCTTPEGRQSLFSGWYLWLMMICNGAVITIYATHLRSAWYYRVKNLWFSSSTGILWLIIPITVPWAFILLSKLIARKAFPGTASDSPTETRLGKLRRYVPYFILFAFFVAADYLANFLPQDALLVHRQFLVVLCLWFSIEHIYGRIVKTWVRLPGSRTLDDGLLHNLSGLASQFGVRMKRVELVDVTPSRTQRVNAILYGDKSLLIRQKLAETLSPEELDFIIAHEFAHSAKNHHTKATATVCAEGLLILAPAVLFVTQPLNLSPLNWQLWLITAGFALLFTDSKRLSRKREEEADILALAATRNPQAAARAITKTSGLQDFSFESLKHPETVSFDTLAPSRLQWLKQAAEKMSLDTTAFGKVEQDDTLTTRAQGLATQMRVKLGKVVVVDLAADEPMVNAGAARGSKIMIGRALVRDFTPEELDFVLAHELAHLKRKHLTKMMAALLLCSLAILSCAAIMLLGNDQLMGYLSWVAILAGLFLAGNITWLSRRRELDADRIALHTTRDYPAAISALNKLTSANPMELPEEFEGYLSHPKQAFRIESLRKEARKLGLQDTQDSFRR